jgi:hypothetical protein
MKNIMSLFLLLFFSATLFAQTSQVPTNIMIEFKNTHPNHDFITWLEENGTYKASSIDDKKLHHVTVYDTDAKVIRTEREILSRDIPTPIIGYFEEKYPGVNNYTVWVVEDNEGNKTYFSNHNDKNITFDKEGRINPGAAPKAN